MTERLMNKLMNEPHELTHLPEWLSADPTKRVLALDGDELIHVYLLAAHVHLNSLCSHNAPYRRHHRQTKNIDQ